MKFVLVPGSRNYKDATNRFVETAKKYFKTSIAAPFSEIKTIVDKTDRSIIYRKTNLCEFDAVYMRSSSPDISYAPIILDILVDAGVYSPIQPDAIPIAKNKFYTLKIMAEAGLPTPKSVLMTSPNIVQDVVEYFDFPVVVKLLGGMGGKGVMLVSNKSDFAPIIDAMARLNQVVAVEEFLKNPGEDHRLFVIGDQVSASMKRKCVKEGEFRANITIGGKPEKYKPTPEEEEIALKAANVIGMEICGVDLIPSENGPVLIEINDGPSLKGISTVTKFDLYDTIVKYIYDRAKS
ncbi:MAG: RimK family alpha-L-glutamate ligase [Candidatus Diapherotrites archaeon]|nr:RimK family alpha-L-glutamate ligase [Candidatus Diapherotrites archaeon]